jgi:hypothetical protein
MAKAKTNPIQLLIVLAIVAGLIALTQLWTTGEVGKVGETDKNLTYEAIKDEIEKLTHEKWRPNMYGGLVSSIENSKSMQAEQKKDLIKGLNAKYAQKLQDTLQGFCKGGAALSIPESILKELEVFKSHAEAMAVKDMVELRDNFNKCVNKMREAIGYTTSAPYEKSTSDKYGDELESCKEIAYIGENKFLKSQIDATIKSLGAHGVLASQFKICVASEDCDCAKFIGNAYYKQTCEKAKKD